MFNSSVAFAYISDVTDESSRSLGYGAVTAGFAASLIISPALGAGIEMLTGSDTIVVIVATLIAVADVVFILFFVPESLTNNCKLKFKTLTFKQVHTTYIMVWQWPSFDYFLHYRLIPSHHSTKYGRTRLF